ncbi:MAG TPA: hypothetical protein VMY16_11840, partial [Ilumatobacteraceae bacterium]|nr:hypothetical protein [Ilumatobacteraceae bacterium]
MRITMADGGVVVDGPSDGRGAWLCRSVAAGEIAAAACLDAALSRRSFARAWRRDVGVDDERAISELVGRRADG